MNGSRNECFSRTRLSMKEHGRVCASDRPATGLAGAKDCSRNIFINGDKTFLMDGFIAKGKIHRVYAQVCVVGIGKSNADAVGAHNLASARHRGSEKVPELEIGNHMIG